jgi:hypothetical protein
MHENLSTILRGIPQQPQRQDGTNAQLLDLMSFAHRLGLYDAADFIRIVVERQRAGASTAGNGSNPGEQGDG